jgi:hypothetical protein
LHEGLCSPQSCRQDGTHGPALLQDVLQPATGQSVYHLLFLVTLPEPTSRSPSPGMSWAPVGRRLKGEQLAWAGDTCVSSLRVASSVGGKRASHRGSQEPSWGRSLFLDGCRFRLPFPDSISFPGCLTCVHSSSLSLSTSPALLRITHEADHLLGFLSTGLWVGGGRAGMLRDSSPLFLSELWTVPLGAVTSHSSSSHQACHACQVSCTLATPPQSSWS